jgi:hypothetical protein
MRRVSIALILAAVTALAGAAPVSAACFANEYTDHILALVPGGLGAGRDGHVPGEHFGYAGLCLELLP